MPNATKRAVVITLASVALITVVGVSTVPLAAQSAPAAGQSASGASKLTGTVKSVDSTSLVVTNKDGQDVTVTVSGATKVLLVPPGSTNLSAATAGTAADIQTGDRALVTGTAGDSATSMSAARVIVMKSAAIEQAHATQSSAWAQGAGGIVKSADADKVVVSSGMKTVTVTVTPKTVVRRYAPGSVKFEDAQLSTVSAIQPGDQLRVRGTKSEDGLSIAADEIVTGSFANYSGTIASIDTNANSITLKDLTTKKTVTVAVTQGADVRRLPIQMATMIAMRMKGGAAGSGAEKGAAKPAAGAAPAGGGGGETHAAAAGEGEEGEQRRANAAGGDLSRMLARLPTETLGGLKSGEAVMIVASPSAADPAKSTAITLLVGVEPILAAPSGGATTLSPWNVSGGEGAAGMGGATP